MQQTDYSVAQSRLEEFGIRPSIQRTVVMDFLMKNPIHPTVDCIFSALSPKMPTLSRTTVYNCVNHFVEMGAIQQLSIDSQCARYDAGLDNHGHFHCKLCNRIFDLPMKEFVPEQVESLKGYEIFSFAHYYKGICRQCKAYTGAIIM